MATTSWFDGTSCAYCAGSSGAKGFVDENLTIEWKSVLPICQVCRADGAIPLARIKRRNGSANAKRAQRNLLTTNVSQAHGDDVTPMATVDTTPPTTSSAPGTTSRGRREESERAAKRPRRRLTSGVRG